MCNDLNLPVTDLLDVDVIAQVAGAAFHLDTVMQEFFECAEVEDLVGDRLRAVDGVLFPQDQSIIYHVMAASKAQVRRGRMRIDPPKGTEVLETERHAYLRCNLLPLDRFPSLGRCFGRRT